MEMKQINIDLDVYKVIEQERKSFNETHNEILRRKYGFEPAKEEKSEQQIGGLYVSGVLLKNGLKLHSNYKGRIIEARVENNVIVYNGKSFTSPSAAAGEATGNSVNGWQWWLFFNEETGKWLTLNRLRRKQTPH